ARLDVALYTPGSDRGRPVSLALAPPDLGKLPEHEREQLSSHAACALGSMLGYKDSCRDKACIALLAQAIRLLAELDHPVSFDNLLEIIGDKEPTLVAAIGYLDKSNFTRLASDLETLKVTRGTLVRSKAPSLDFDELLGRGPHAVPGRTRLSIVSTKFLGDERGALFFVAQLLVGLARWASKNPAATLQAALLADEADLYLPAASKPPTKEPMENLLKRARSAGLSIMLATQSPGDLDYRSRDTIRSWFVGRVKEQTALAKMKPMLADCRAEVFGRIPGQGTGDFHLLQEGSAIAFHACESLVRAVQVPEEAIQELAARTTPRTAVA
ncbi:MAG TPA: AAA family ATPase, partial [Myxococcales bacterium]|nr:AAA family ATPase [Myxococcales bacterium]